MLGSDEPLCLDVDVKVVVEQMDVGCAESADELLLLDNDVNCRACDRDGVTDTNDVALTRQTRLSFDGLDEPFCLDDHVLIDEQVDV